MAMQYNLKSGMAGHLAVLLLFRIVLVILDFFNFKIGLKPYLYNSKLVFSDIALVMGKE